VQGKRDVLRINWRGRHAFRRDLMERTFDFVAYDMPSTNAFMINIYAAMPQEERRFFLGFFLRRLWTRWCFSQTMA
jgi:hypothetical protein